MQSRAQGLVRDRQLWHKGQKEWRETDPQKEGHPEAVLNTCLQPRKCRVSKPVVSNGVAMKSRMLKIYRTVPRMDNSARTNKWSGFYKQHQGGESINNYYMHINPLRKEQADTIWVLEGFKKCQTPTYPQSTLSLLPLLGLALSCSTPPLAAWLDTRLHSLGCLHSPSLWQHSAVFQRMRQRAHCPDQPPISAGAGTLDRG